MYTSFYNLSDRPFRLTPDLQYFYSSSAHKRAIVHMRFGLEQSDGILLLTGAKGIGKTTLLHYLLAEMDETRTTVAFMQKPVLKDNDFLPAILASLQIPITEYQPRVLFETLRKFLIKKSEEGQKVLLIIDEGQDLTQNCFEFLRLLSTIKFNENGLLQIVLSGTNELDDLIAVKENQSFRQQIVMSYNIHPMQISDTKAYIKFRLKQAGWEGDPQIDEETYLSIHQLTGGIPYEINHYFDRLLVLGMLQETHHISNTDVSRLTHATLAKIDKFEKQLAIEEKPDAISVKGQPDVFIGPSKEKVIEQPLVNSVEPEATAKKTEPKKHFFDKGTLTTIAASYLLSLISVFVINQYVDAKNNDLIAMKAQEEAVAIVSPEVIIPEKIQEPESNDPGELGIKMLNERAQEQEKDDATDSDSDLRGSNDVEETLIATLTPAAEPHQLPTSIEESELGQVSSLAPIEPVIAEVPPVILETETVVTEKTSPDRSIVSDKPDFATNNEKPVITLAKSEVTNISKVFNTFQESITEIDLNKVVAQFEVAYQFGDMQKIDSIFSLDVLSNNIKQKSVLMDEYQKLFDITDFRRMRIFNVEWEVNDTVSKGEGSFEASIREKGSAEKKKYKGTIILHVKKQEKGLEISELYYNYENL